MFGCIFTRKAISRIHISQRSPPPDGERASVSITEFLNKSSLIGALDLCRIEERLLFICSTYKIVFYLVCMFAGERGNIKLHIFEMEFGPGLPRGEKEALYGLNAPL